MKKIKQAVFFLIALLYLNINALYAEPQVSVRTEHYQVTGNTLDELSESMTRNAPPQLSGFFALTKWNVSWKYNSSPVGSGCSVTSLNVKLDVVFTLPEWRGEANADEKIRKKWNKFIKNLQKHEDGHQQIGLEAARKIEKILTQGKIYDNCQQVGQILNQSSEAVLTEKRAEEVRYDERTKHGQRQGAQLKYSNPE